MQLEKKQYSDVPQKNGMPRQQKREYDRQMAKLRSISPVALEQMTGEIRRDAVDGTVDIMVAIFIKALNERHGFGKKRIKEIMGLIQMDFEKYTGDAEELQKLKADILDQYQIDFSDK